MHRVPPLWIDAIWIVFWIVWTIAAAGVKPATRQESAATRVPYTLVVIVSFLLVFDPMFGTGFLARRFVPDSPAVQFAGLAVTIAGVAVAFWARAILGGNWSSVVTIKKDHELIRCGPYAFVRHPIYTGILMMLLGTVLVVGQVRGLISLALSFAGWRMKSLIEERFMMDQFGERYVDYKRHVKALIPWIY